MMAHASLVNVSCSYVILIVQEYGREAEVKGEGPFKVALWPLQDSVTI